MILLMSKAAAKNHFLALPPEDRYSRFCIPASDDYIKNYVDNAEGFFYGIPSWLSSPAHVGVVHICYDKKTESVEVAVSVLPDFKGQNIGTKLMSFAQGVAEMYRAKQLVISGLSMNSPMIKLAKSCGYEIHSEMGEFEGSAPTIGADIQTITDNNIKLFNILLGVTDAS